ncbi:MAG: magnesium/cobalt transporter CorA [Bacteroidia bacterium]
MNYSRFQSELDLSTPPGTLSYNGRVSLSPSRLYVFEYNEVHLLEKEYELSKVTEIHKQAENIFWLDVEGLQNTHLISEIGEKYLLHSLLLEDLVNVEHRPKLEEFDNACVIIAKMLTYNVKEKKVESEHISLVLTDDKHLITFQEREGDVFDPVRERLRRGMGKIRKKNANYLLYALLDAIIDNYFFIVEQIEEDLSLLETRILQNPSEKAISELHGYKRQLMDLRKFVLPLREVMSSILRGEGEVLDAGNEVYMRDLYGNVLEVIEDIDEQRDVLSGLQDFCFSSISNKMNNTMKTLTNISLLFMPMSLITGIYGMNFDNMPELHSRYGYFFAIAMILIVGMMMYFFIKRKTE